MGTALEMFSTDHSGRYPKAMADLVPDYLLAIPNCPAAGTDSYTTGLATAANPDAYTLVCSGHHHAAVDCDANYPQYN